MASLAAVAAVVRQVVVRPAAEAAAEAVPPGKATQLGLRAQFFTRSTDVVKNVII